MKTRDFPGRGSQLNVLGGPLLSCINVPGLQPGQRWCLCAARWLEACQAGSAPRVSLNATNQAALEVVPLELLKLHAIDLHCRLWCATQPWREALRGTRK